MDGRLAEVVAFISHDLSATLNLPFCFLESAWISDVEGDDRLAVEFLIGLDADRPALHSRGRRAWIWPETDLSTRLYHLLDVVQEEAMEARPEAGLWAYWPRCPWHPRSHPLTVSDQERPRWVCPVTEEPTPWLVGSLPTAQDPP